MNKKILIFMSVIVLLIAFLAELILWNIRQRKETPSQNDSLEEKYYYDYEFDDISGHYLVTDENGVIIKELEDEQELEFYLRHPDYNPQIPVEENFISEEYY